MTLYTALVGVSKAAAPMIPFITEDIYQNLVRSVDKDALESIHLCDFPVLLKRIERIHRISCRSDPWVVLLSACDFDADF